MEKVFVVACLGFCCGFTGMNNLKFYIVNSRFMSETVRTGPEQAESPKRDGGSSIPYHRRVVGELRQVDEE
jgi:hypothetical protein